MSKGNATTIMAVQAELSTQEAADLLNVSRPYVLELLENGEIPYRKVGTHRRIAASQLLDYKKKVDVQRLAALDELTAQAQELGMGYE
jgi:excisionase family DNA binding protein